MGRNGRELLANEPVFAATVAQAEPVILRECGFSVTEAMSSPQTVTGQDRIQPTLFTMQVALAATLRAYGVRPGAVIGHSVGEAAAAVVAGALSLEDGLRVVCRRSQLMSRIAGAGATASVQLPAQQVLSEFAVRGNNDVVVAVVASPESTVIAGAAAAVRELVAAWEQRDVMAREIPTDVAFHSPQVDPIVGELTESLAELTPMTPEIPFYSATLYDPREQPSCDAPLLGHNMRRMVRFAAAVRAALEDGYRVFAELSPHPLLTHAVEQTGRSLDTPLTTLAGMRREQELPHGLRDFVADYTAQAQRSTFRVLYPDGRLVDAPLPTWTHRRLWLEQRQPRSLSAWRLHGVSASAVRAARAPAGGTRAPRLAGPRSARMPTLGWAITKSTMSLCCPAAGYGEMALAAARTVLGEAAEARDIRFEQALLLDRGDHGRRSRNDRDAGRFHFIVDTSQQGEQVRHAARGPARRGTFARTTAPATSPACWPRTHAARRRGVRDRLSQNGIQYGPAFTGSGCGAYRRATSMGHRAGRDRAQRPDARQPGRLRRAPGAVGRLFPIRRGPSRTFKPSAKACWLCPSVFVAFAPTVPRATPATAMRGSPASMPPASKPTSRCSTNTEWCCSSCRVCDLPPAYQRAATKTGCLPSGCWAFEWRPQQLPELPRIDAGTWLLIGCAHPDAVTTELERGVGSPWRALHDHALARRSRQFERRRTQKPFARAVIHRRGDRDRAERRRGRAQRCPRPRVCATSGAHRPRSGRDRPANHRGCMS